MAIEQPRLGALQMARFDTANAARAIDRVLLVELDGVFCSAHPTPVGQLVEDRQPVVDAVLEVRGAG